MRSGYIRDRIRITHTPDIKDAGGGVTAGPKVIYWETFAEVTTIKNERNAQSYQTDLEEPKEFSLRFRADKTVTKNMLVEYKGKEYTIQSINDEGERKRELIIVGLTRK
jgi:SPP1 family predicted phage head-tail adaptor